jgi:hypothetical protein
MGKNQRKTKQQSGSSQSSSASSASVSTASGGGDSQQSTFSTPLKALNLNVTFNVQTGEPTPEVTGTNASLAPPATPPSQEMPFKTQQGYKRRVEEATRLQQAERSGRHRCLNYGSPGDDKLTPPGDSAWDPKGKKQKIQVLDDFEAYDRRITILKPHGEATLNDDRERRVTLRVEVVGEPDPSGLDGQLGLASAEPLTEGTTIDSKSPTFIEKSKKPGNLYSREEIAQVVSAAATVLARGSQGVALLLSPTDIIYVLFLGYIQGIGNHWNFGDVYKHFVLHAINCPPQGRKANCEYVFSHDDKVQLRITRDVAKGEMLYVASYTCKSRRRLQHPEYSATESDYMAQSYELRFYRGNELSAIREAVVKPRT